MAAMTSLLANPSDDIATEFMEHMLRISSPDKMLNSVLGRLERNRKPQSGQRVPQEEECEDSEELILPQYTDSVESSQERQMRQLGPHKHYPICHLARRIRKLSSDEYEYRPAYYEEVRCIPADRDFPNEICSSLGFSCVQWNKTVHVTRRLYSSDCWETQTLMVPAGCECMWPVHRLGDMTPHVS